MTDFAKLGVSEERVAILKAMGIITPTPVQEETIPIVKAGHDVISQAQTGTGKTLAFVLPMLDKIKTDVQQIQGLIVTPTRELAIQITTEIKKLLTREDGIKVLAVYGGQDVEAQLFKLKGNIHIVVATPGRLLDHLRRETIALDGVRMLVLDEADQMLHMGFLKEVEEILRQTPYKKQAMLFSATMPASIREMAGRILRNPQHVTVKSERVTVKDIRQWVVETSDREKQATLVRLLEETQPYLSIIFCRTKRRANTLNVALQEMGYSSDELHGDLSQAKREQVMKRFRDAKLQLLVATDVAARGLDVEGVTHVFNYDVPIDVESYIHRIGRTGRAGEKGLAITLIAPKDRRELADIENGIQMVMERRSEEGRPLGGGGLEGPRNSGGLGRPGSGGGRSSGRSSAGQAKGRSISASKSRGGDKSYGASAGGGRGRSGEGRRGAPVAKPGAGNRSSTGEWVDRGQSRDAVKAGRGGRSSANASDEAIGFTFSERGERSAPAGRASGGRGKPGAGGNRSGGSFGRLAEERGAGRPSTGGSSRRNSAERFAERAAENTRFERKDERGSGFGRSSGGATGGGFSKGGRKSEQRGGNSIGGGRSSGPKSGGFSGGGNRSGGFKGGPKGPSGGGGRGASRGR